MTAKDIRLAETALSVVTAKWGETAIAERNKLQAEVEALRKERDELLEFKEDVHNHYPASQLKVDQTNADFIVATYVGERHFKIPDDADRTKLDSHMRVKWGKLMYVNTEGRVCEAEPIEDDITDSMEFDKWARTEHWVTRDEYLKYSEGYGSDMSSEDGDEPPEIVAV